MSDIAAVLGHDSGNVPPVVPDISWQSLSAGNLKKMKRNREPSKKQDVNARVKMLLSESHRISDELINRCWHKYL